MDEHHLGWDGIYEPTPGFGRSGAALAGRQSTSAAHVPLIEGPTDGADGVWLSLAIFPVNGVAEHSNLLKQGCFVIS